MKKVRILTMIIVLVGASLTGRALYLHAKAELAGILIRRAWEQSIRTGGPHPPWAWADTHPIGRLRIPRLGYDEIVLEGATPRTLAFGPARLMSGAAMGDAGNLVLAGHRTSWFRSLEGIKRGDTIEVDSLDAQGQLHEQIYRVDIVRVTTPEDVSLLTPTLEDSLTLITCYPFGWSPRSAHRFVVRASPAG
jgi:sortase A